MPESKPKPEAGTTDPEEILQQMEIELALKRAQRGQVKARYGNMRALSFAFLAVVLLGALVGFYWLMSSNTLQEMRANAAPASPSPALTPR